MPISARPASQNLTTTTTALTASPNPSLLGQSVTFTATVSGSGGTPTGTVDFTEGASTLGSGSLSSGVATFNTSALSLGPHDITAVYNGDSTFAASTSSVVTQTVDPTTLSMVITPETPISSSGNNGGPFSPSSFQYQLSASSGSISYSISGLPAWLTFRRRPAR